MLSGNKNLLFVKKFKECAYRITEDAVKGYIFGSFIGVFIPTHRSLSSSMFNTGISFAKISASYSATQLLLETFNKEKKPLASFLSGAIVGYVGVKRNPIVGSFIYGTYFTVADHFLINKTND